MEEEGEEEEEEEVLCVYNWRDKTKKERERKTVFQLTFSADGDSVWCLLFVLANLYASHSMLSTVCII